MFTFRLKVKVKFGKPLPVAALGVSTRLLYVGSVRLVLGWVIVFGG